MRDYDIIYNVDLDVDVHIPYLEGLSASYYSGHKHTVRKFILKMYSS